MSSAKKSLFSRADVLRPGGFQISVFSLLLGTLVINILSLALPVMTLQVYDRILPNPGSGTLPVLISGVCLAVILEGALRLSRTYMMGWAGSAYEHRLSCEAMSHVLKSNPLQIKSYGIGEHLHRMAAISKLRDFYNGYSLMVFFELAFVPFFLALIYYLAGLLVFIPALILAVFTLSSFWEGRKLRQALKNRDKADDKRFNFLIESLDGIHTVKAFALERFFERRYEALEEKSSLANYNVTQNTASMFNMGAIFSHIMVAAVISIGSFFVLDGQLTTGVLIATLLLSGRMMQPVQRMLVLWAKYQDYMLAREKLEKLFAMRVHAPRVIHKKFSREGRLEITGLSFRYRKSDPFLFKNIQLSIQPGESVLISGEHSSGKTTLLRLIAGIYPAVGRNIKVDGVDISRYPQGRITQHVGYIRTESLIFRGSIRDNLTCFGQTDEKNAREVASILKVDRDVSKLPFGFDTFLSGNDTDSIPPGLKQRIAMVRVFSTKPSLILFDNADRGLDREGYALVCSLLAGLKGKTSLIFVTDDWGLQGLADRRFVLEKGKLVETYEPRGQDNRAFCGEIRL